MRYFIWGAILIGLALVLGVTFFGDPSDPSIWGYQILGVLICGIAGIVAIVGKAGSELRKDADIHPVAAPIMAPVHIFAWIIFLAGLIMIGIAGYIYYSYGSSKETVDVHSEYTASNEEPFVHEINQGRGFQIQIPTTWTQAFVKRVDHKAGDFFSLENGITGTPVKWWTSVDIKIIEPSGLLLTEPRDLLHIDILAYSDAEKMGIKDMVTGPGGKIVLKRVQAGDFDAAVVFSTTICVDCELGEWYTDRRLEVEKVIDSFTAIDIFSS